MLGNLRERGNRSQSPSAGPDPRLSKFERQAAEVSTSWHLWCRFSMFRPMSGFAWKRRILVLSLVVVTAGCSGGSESGGATTSTLPLRSTSTTAPLSEQVEDAYLASWRAYERAVRNLDAGGLARAYAEDALETVVKEVQRRRREGAPVRVDVEHSVTVQVLASGTDALVRDQYVTRSVRLDPQTGEPAEPVSPETVRETYQMKLLGDRWKVTAIVRAES